MKVKHCEKCQRPFPTTGLFKLRDLTVCANCLVLNKRMFKWPESSK